jgi:type VI secretion system FHA domain protein
MSLRLGIENVPSLASGDPVEISLAEHGLVIGRAGHADWTLPDPNSHISSIHCEVDYRDGRYFLTDKSTNGTFINGSNQRLTAPVQLRDGDLLQIGHYQIRVEEVGDGTSTTGFGASSGTAGFGGGIDWGADAASAAHPVSAAKFGREAARPVFQSGDDPLMRAFTPPAPAARPDPFGMAPPATDPFGTTRSEPDPFGIAAPPPAPTSPNPFGIATTPATDPFGMAAQLPAARVADPFGTARSAPDPFGMAAPAAPPAPAATDPWAMLSGAGAVAFTSVAPPAPPPPPPAPVAPISAPSPAAPATSAPAAPIPAAGDELFDRLLAASGLERRDLGNRSPDTVVAVIGQLLRQTADGLFKLLEARTRVRHQFGVGAQVTTFQRTGNNPLKWTRSPEQALKQMIGEPGPGFLDGTQAVLGAFEDLQAHEMAMMAAMQEAMQETIRRFAPDTIRGRISAKGWLKSVLPGSREATLWRAYESEFSAFANESEAAYLDLFAKQFKKAYERIVSTAEQKG